MMLYLDEVMADPRLTQVLRREGFAVQTPHDADLLGKSDVRQFTYAVSQGFIVVSRDHKNFKELDDLCKVLRGHHPGIIVIREDNDRKRDMKHGDIVRALCKLIASGQSFADGYFILNQWR